MALTDSYSVLDFSFYKGQSIQDITRFSFDGCNISKEKKLRTFFISDHFKSLRFIDLPNNQLTNIQFPTSSPELRGLYLASNRLTRLTIGDVPNLFNMGLKYNEVKELSLKTCYISMSCSLLLKGNPLKSLTLPYGSLHETGIINESMINIQFDKKIPSVTAYYCPFGAKAFDKNGAVDFSILSPKKLTLQI